MAEDGNGFNCENGSSKSQTSTSEERRRARKEANHVWAAPLKRRKVPRGNPEAAASKRGRSAKQVPQRAEGRMLLSQRVPPIKELESLSVHMPNVSDSDARAFAVRMYYNTIIIIIIILIIITFTPTTVLLQFEFSTPVLWSDHIFARSVRVGWPPRGTWHLWLKP